MRRHHDHREAAKPLPLLLLSVLLSGCSSDDSPKGLVEAARAQQTAMAVAVPLRRPLDFEEVALARRDSTWQVVPAEAGGPWGVFWYRPYGRSFDWFVRAEGLTPGRVYRLQLNLGDKSYAISSMLADARGLLRGYGSLPEFRELLCGSSEHFDAPTPLSGEHEFGVWIVDDGTNVTSPSDSRADPLRPGRRRKLPCAGNGDGSFELRLAEVALARFEGR